MGHWRDDPPAKAVERGAVMLDTLQPDWWQLVDPGNLVMGKNGHDVLGQLYGTTYHGMAYLGISEIEALWGGLKMGHGDIARRFATYWKRGIRHGLPIRVHRDHTKAWRDEIHRRVRAMVD